MKYQITLSFFLMSLALAADEFRAIKAGMIGLDTSHAVAFTEIFHSPKAEGDVAKVRIVAAFPGGSGIEASQKNIPSYTEKMRGLGVEILGSIAELLAKVDVVLLESVDGRTHLAEARQVFQAKKPLFIDKPVAGSLTEAVAIYRLAEEHKVPCFSSSALRFQEGLVGLKNSPQVGEIIGCDSWGPCHAQEGVPDLYYYGVHGIESLITIMGPGCESVSRSSTASAEQVTGVWKDGRIGTFRGIHSGKAEFGVTAFGTTGIVSGGQFRGYDPLIKEIASFFVTGKAPFSAEETLEIFAFMDAAEESKRQGGKPVKIAEALANARAEAASR